LFKLCFFDEKVKQINNIQEFNFHDFAAVLSKFTILASIAENWHMLLVRYVVIRLFRTSDVHSVPFCNDMANLMPGRMLNLLTQRITLRNDASYNV
jgi:hypothetical protein